MGSGVAAPSLPAADAVGTLTGGEHSMTEQHEVPGVRFIGDSTGDGQFPVQSAEQRLIEMIRAFDDPSQEWRRLFAELFGTFFLVLVAAGGPMMDQAIPGRRSARRPWWSPRA